MKTAIISPSGQFYGSEQTLYSYLTKTKYKFDLYLNKHDGKFINQLEKINHHNIFPFSNIKILYILITIKLFQNKYNSIYCNEGGHLRYIKIIAKLFPKKKFTVHIRLKDDTSAKRIGKLPSNICLLSVSKYISNLIKENLNISTHILSSPSRGIQDNLIWTWNKSIGKSINMKIGVVGRITTTKGIKEISEFIKYSKNKKIEFHFFGEIEKDKEEVNRFIQFSKRLEKTQVFFHGFKSKDKIYNSIDVIVHFNKFESLGVIFFEALNYGKPFIGFNSGGIGDIALNLGISDLMIEDIPDWKKQLDKLLSSIDNNLPRYIRSQQEISKLYSIENYSKTLDYIIIIP